jgi:hypothetical protein
MNFRRTPAKKKKLGGGGYTNETEFLKLIQRKYLRTFIENKILLLEVLS